MSAFARSPESYAAWQQLKRNVHYESAKSAVLTIRMMMMMNNSAHNATEEPRNCTAFFPESPTPERIERFCRVSEEVTRLAEHSFLRTLERDRYQDMCIADLQEGIENYRHMFDEHLKLVDFVHQQHVLALQKQIELEKRKRVYAENELRKATSAHGGP
ncbi:hypothetical protein BGY98DRAFT_1098502 [Russula aff. rugulosa BPL654]|nr:hypothetical protein BGY98DRAFT_1098502 [Russula aff. rugulosa BPL654]